MTESSYVDALMAIFPGSRLRSRRTPDEHAAHWRRLTRDANTRKHGEALAAARLEQLRREHGDAS